MSPLDQYYRNVRNLEYMPRSKYMLNPPTVDDLEKEDEGDVENLIVNPVVPTKNIGGGGISSLPTNQLMADFGTAVQKRQQNLENPSFIAQKMYDMGFPQQRSVDQMMRDATAYNMAELGPTFKQIGITPEMSKAEQDEAMRLYAADETSIGNYPAEDPRDVRFQFGIPNISSILSRILPNSYYDKMTVSEQIYTQSKMGYRGPTIFGANDSGLQKDIFGRNIVSGFGNYAKAQKRDIDKLDDYFGSKKFEEKYGFKGSDFLEVDEEGNYFFDYNIPAELRGTRLDPNYMNKLNLQRYGYDKRGLAELSQIDKDTGYADIRAAEAQFAGAGGDRAAQAAQKARDDRTVAEANRAFREGRDDGYSSGAAGVQSDGSYNDPFDPGGGEKDGGFIDGTNRRKLNVGGLAGILGF